MWVTALVSAGLNKDVIKEWITCAGSVRAPRMEASAESDFWENGSTGFFVFFFTSSSLLWARKSSIWWEKKNCCCTLRAPITRCTAHSTGHVPLVWVCFDRLTADDLETLGYSCIKLDSTLLHIESQVQSSEMQLAGVSQWRYSSHVSA